jgi:hypothetical protein
LIDAVGTVELEHSVEEIHCNRFVFGSPEKQLEDAVVVDIDVIVNFLVLCDASGDITPGLVRFGDVLEHFCILFSVHKESFAAWGHDWSMWEHDAIAIKLYASIPPYDGLNSGDFI